MEDFRILKLPVLVLKMIMFQNIPGFSFIFLCFLVNQTRHYDKYIESFFFMMDLTNLDIAGGKAVDLKAACDLMPLPRSKDEENWFLILWLSGKVLRNEAKTYF